MSAASEAAGNRSAGERVLPFGLALHRWGERKVPGRRRSWEKVMPSCGCDGHINRRDTATLCVVLLLVAVHIGFGYLWLHSYKSHVAETTGGAAAVEG